MDILLTAVKLACKSFFFLLNCLVASFEKLRNCLRKRQRCPLMSDPMLLLPATEITRKVRERKISCEEVMAVYVKRCKEVNPVINAIVEDRFEAALQEARQLDDFLRTTIMSSEVLAREKPLLGLPVSVKESIAVQGMSFCSGMKEDPSPRATHDAEAVAKIREAGAIPFLVSNTPELCLWLHTFNKITGRTRNPYDTQKTPGGSSGGEAALLGAGASLVGLCSDIAGSSRIPALFCGIFGHKPTPKWISVNGHKPSSTDANWPFVFAISIMTRYATDLSLFLKAASQSNDEAALNLQKQVCLGDLKYYYMDNSGSILTNSISGDMKAAIYKLVNHLETTYSVKVQKANLKGMKSSFEMSTIILLNIKNIYSIFNRWDDPQKSRNVFAELFRYFFCLSPHIYPVFLYGLAKNIGEKIPRSYYNKIIEKKTRLKKEFEELLGDNGVLIYPSFVSSAPYSSELICNVFNLTYLMIFNVLGLPVTQCPLGFDKNQMPVGLQIVANPNCDHLTIAVAQEVERAFGGWRETAVDERTTRDTT